jgi:hypothetical protein
MRIAIMNKADPIDSLLALIWCLDGRILSVRKPLSNKIHPAEAREPEVSMRVITGWIIRMVDTTFGCWNMYEYDL